MRCQNYIQLFIETEQDQQHTKTTKYYEQFVKMITCIKRCLGKTKIKLNETRVKSRLYKHTFVWKTETLQTS